MRSVDKLVEMIENRLPVLVKTKHLVELGIYNSAQGAYQARRARTSPPWLKIPRQGVVYPRDGVIEFLRKCEERKAEAELCGHERRCLKNAQKQA